MDGSAARVNRASGVFSGALLVFISFAIYSWIATNGSIDSRQLLGVLILVTALPSAFLVFAIVRVIKAVRALTDPGSAIRYRRMLEPPLIVLLCVSLVVGVAASAALGTFGTAANFYLFVVGFLVAAILGMALVSLTTLAAYLFATRFATWRPSE